MWQRSENITNVKLQVVYSYPSVFDFMHININEAIIFRSVIKILQLGNFNFFRLFILDLNCHEVISQEQYFAEMQSCIFTYTKKHVHLHEEEIPKKFHSRLNNQLLLLPVGRN